MTIKVIVQSNEVGLLGITDEQRERLKPLLTFQHADWKIIRKQRLDKIEFKVKELDKAMKNKEISYNDYVFKSKRLYQDQKYWSEWDGQKCYLSNNNRFPIGFLSRIKKALYLHDPNFLFIDTRRQPVKLDREINFTGNLRGYQDVIFRDNKDAGMGLFDIATGSGKTIMAIAFMCYLNVKTVVLVPTVALVNQWIKSIKDFSDAKVGYAQGKQLIEGDFYVMNQATLNTAIRGGAKVQSTIDRQDKIRKIWMREADCIIIDECHHASAKTWDGLIKMSTSYYRFAFSATIGKRSDKGDFSYYALLGEKLEALDYETLVDFGGAVPVDLYFHEVPYVYYDRKKYSWGKIAEKLDDKGNVIREHKESIEESYIVYNMERINIILEVALDRAIRKDKNTLLLFRRLDQGEIFLNRAKLIIESDPRYQLFRDSLNKIEIVNGKTKRTVKNNQREEIYQKFREGKIKLLIAQTQLIGEGWDIKSIQVVVVGTGGKSEIANIQRLGRGARTADGKYILELHDFADQGYMIQDHAKKRMDDYLDTGARFINPNESYLGYYAQLR